MKKTLLILIIALAFVVPLKKGQAQVSVNVDFNTFYTELSPYGRWIDYPQYGRVWICNERGFQPYGTNGHWVYTDMGWTWVSDYPWGWAPFHYGRWAYDDAYGWFWVPGYEWAPAWVSWRNSNDYYGWAPLAPGLHVSVGVSFGSIPASRWVFVPRQYIASPAVHNYYVDRSRNVTIINNTTIINNVHVTNNQRVNYVAGPRREEVERVTHTSIRPASFSNASRPGRTVVNNNTINVYRPTINRTTVNNRNTTINNNQRINNNRTNTTITNRPVPNNGAPQSAVRPGARQPVNQPAVRPNPHQNNVPQQRPAPQQRSFQHPAQPVRTPQQYPVQQPQRQPVQHVAPRPAPQQQRPQPQPVPHQQPQPNRPQHHDR